MIVEYVRYRIPANKTASFEADYAEAAAFLRESEYCMGYELTHCEEEPELYILRIEWTSTEDHLNGFRKSKEFEGFLPLVRPYIEHLEEMQHYAITPILFRK